MSVHASSFKEGYFHVDGQWKITAHHDISEVTPAMIDWWWDHIDTTERYRLWHPTDHVSFEWIISPQQAGGHVGAVQRIQEFFNGTPPEGPLTLVTRWEDPTSAPIQAAYRHVLLASGFAQGGLPNATLMHEYEESPRGTRMRSHFWFPADAPEITIQMLYEHNKQEMANLCTFLPWLYYAEVELSRGTGYFALGDKRITRVRIEEASGAVHFHYRLWENWREQTNSMTASSISLLLKSQQIDLAKWSWHTYEKGTTQ